MYSIVTSLYVSLAIIKAIAPTHRHILLCSVSKFTIYGQRLPMYYHTQRQLK